MIVVVVSNCNCFNFFCKQINFNQQDAFDIKFNNANKLISLYHNFAHFFPIFYYKINCNFVSRLMLCDDIFYDVNVSIYSEEKTVRKSIALFNSAFIIRVTVNYKMVLFRFNLLLLVLPRTLFNRQLIPGVFLNCKLPFTFNSINLFSAFFETT